MIEDIVIKLIRENPPELWPIYVFSGPSHSGKTAFKELLAGEFNDFFDLWEINTCSQWFKWWTTRNKRASELNLPEEDLDHIFVEGSTPEEKEQNLLALNPIYTNRHPPFDDCPLYGWGTNLIEQLRQGPLTFSISAEHTIKTLNALHELDPRLHIVTYGIASDLIKTQENRKNIELPGFSG